MQAASIGFNKANINQAGLGASVLVIVLLAMMMLPLPPIILDILFTFSISLSLLVLLASVYARKPLDFAVFPIVLLISTLFRLALNIASTRVVLLKGHSGTDAAGQVIEAFGEVVIGGNYAVGLVVFAILVIINFVVVTKGAGRISEVSARFTLDALPGKQMAIDADLNAGIINQDEAKVRRQEVSKESDFYGAMDGASKFVRGDAIAGIIILFINVLGGLLIGMLQHNMGFADATRVYALLTIGDGLVAQVPSLLLSTAAAMMVTRVSSDEDLGEQVVGQMFRSPKPIAIAGGILLLLGVIPGMPHFAFMGLGSALGGLAYFMHQRTQVAQNVDVDEQEAKAQQQAAAQQKQQEENKDLSWEDVPTVDSIGLEVGYRLIPIVDQTQGGQLMSRIKGVRKKLSQELGFLIPTVHIRDNLELSPNTYRISVMGVTLGEGTVYPDKDLAINPGQVFGNLEGINTKDPTFGLDAVWIDKDRRDYAQTLGYTVVDSSTVIATNLSHLLNESSHQLIGHEEVQKLLDLLAKSAPKLVEDLVPKTISLSCVLKVLQNLLYERVPIRDMRTIAEALAETAPHIQDPMQLTAAVRVALSNLIVQQICGIEEELPVITLNPNLEQILQQSLQAGSEGSGIEPGLAEKIQTSLREFAERQEMSGQPAVLVISPAIRLFMARFVRHGIPALSVLSYQEIPDNKQIRIISSIGS